MTRKFIVTTSWDDGYPADLKLAELLAKHGIAGTFYVPTRNSEGRAVMTEAEIKRLSAAFEIGGHSIDHVVLTALTPSEAERQIRDNRRWLEDVTGRAVPGFCYVQGRYNGTVRDIVQRLGFEYARTVENLRIGVADDPFQLPTTIQLYPHARSVYAKNFVARPAASKLRLLWAALGASDLRQRIDGMVDLCARDGGTFHLWGHSWELEEENLWPLLEDVLARLKASGASFATNHQTHLARVNRVVTPSTAVEPT